MKPAILLIGFGQLLLAALLFVVAAMQDFPVGHMIGLAGLLIATCLTFVENRLATLVFGAGTVIAWLSILMHYPTIQSSENIPSCDGCGVIVPFFSGVAKLAVYGGTFFGLALSVVLIGGLIAFFRYDAKSAGETGDRTNA